MIIITAILIIFNMTIIMLIITMVISTAKTICNVIIIAAIYIIIFHMSSRL